MLVFTNFLKYVGKYLNEKSVNYTVYTHVIYAIAFIWKHVLETELLMYLSLAEYKIKTY